MASSTWALRRQPALLKLAAALPTASVALLLLAASLTGFGGTLYNVSLLSLRQGAAPDHLLGRVNGTMQFLVWGAMPVGALLGGTLAGLVGLHETVTIVALGVQVAVAWILLSPVRSLRQPAAQPVGAPLSLARDVGTRPRNYRPSNDIPADVSYAQRMGRG